jgi:Spy/CpxP family protein refolding chaperone
MSDEEEYTNLDLETAEQLMFAAGKPELSKALHHHAHGVRNLVQGEWGKSFVNSLEDLLIKHIDPLAASQKETQDGVAALSGLFQSLAESVDGLQVGLRESQEDRQAIHEELAAVKADVAELQAQFTAYAAGTKRDELDALKAQLAEMRGDYTPEQRAHLTGILLRMIAEYEAAHGDGDQ